MDYFTILNLKQEPFSNSPEPEFFYQGSQYQACLQKLELAIRLCRGSNVVMGDVGTGKTTLCRQLILKLGEAEEDKGRIETHLILDPSFSSAAEFLSVVARMFGIPEGPADTSEWQVKEDIKQYLFGKGVDEGKVVVLIIDEGQKLPDFCVEILREFLNYETNERKLLQIVIFAQREFEQFLKEHANFADRINQYYVLRPLGFLDTVRMIRFRLARASQSPPGPALFSPAGFLAVYRATKGYPRRINTLCHQIMLALIIQNRTKAGWFLVQACAQRALLSRVGKAGWAAGIALAAVCVVLVVSHYVSPAKTADTASSTVGEPRYSAPVSPVQANTAVQAAAGPVAAVSSSGGELGKSADPERKMPEVLGKLKVRRGASMWSIFADVYGVFDRRRFELLMKANPHVSNSSLVKVGEVVNLPALPVPGNPLSEKPYRVELGRRNTLPEAHQLLKEYPEGPPRPWLVPFWSKQSGMVYAVMLKDGFGDEGAALRVRQQLPQPFGQHAKVISKWEADTIFFSRQ
jgi:general secretion pathway protein A